MTTTICPTVIINRAVPGSGKTTVSRCIDDELHKANLRVGVHSTDEFFMIGNRYVFDIKKLWEYHTKTLDNFISDLRIGLDVVICDNTNLLPWEVEPYTKAAREYGYRIIVINFAPRELEKHLAAQQVTPERPDAHNLTEDTLIRFIEDFETYNDLLDKEKPIDPERHFVYYWDNELCQHVRSDEPTRHFDSDLVVTILPEEYNEIKQTIGASILEQVVT